MPRGQTTYGIIHCTKGNNLCENSQYERTFLKEAAMKKVGMDAGGTFVKIAFQEHGSIHKKVYSNEQASEAVNWLKFLVPGADIAVTGGKAERLKIY
jgi:pantothenate kinase